MPHLSEDEMNFIRAIRREYATALRNLEENETPETRAAFEEANAKRSRAVRSLDEEYFPAKQISAILSCSKNYVRGALRVRSM